MPNVPVDTTVPNLQSAVLVLVDHRLAQLLEQVRITNSPLAQHSHAWTSLPRMLPYIHTQISDVANVCPSGGIPLASTCVVVADCPSGYYCPPSGVCCPVAGGPQTVTVGPGGQIIAPGVAFPGLPGAGFPGVGLPGAVFPGVFPGTVFPGIGVPGVGIPGQVIRPIAPGPIIQPGQIGQPIGPGQIGPGRPFIPIGPGGPLIPVLPTPPIARKQLTLPSFIHLHCHV